MWPPSGLDEQAIPAWTIAIDGMDAGLLQAAAAEWVQTSKWFPKPYELISLANEIKDTQIREGVLSLPELEREYTPLAKLLQLKADFEAMGVQSKHIDRCIAEARIREGQAA